MCRIMLEMMEDRIRFIVETSAFFKANFLVTEGFVKLGEFHRDVRHGRAGGMR